MYDYKLHAKGYISTIKIMGKMEIHNSVSLIILIIIWFKAMSPTPSPTMQMWLQNF